MKDPQEHVLNLIFGRWRSQILYAGVKLGIFDALRNGTKSARTIALELKLDPDLTYRLMRALGSLALLTEGAEHTFSLTEAGERLCSDHPHTLHGVTLLEEGPEHYAIWKHLSGMIRNGKQNAFIREFSRMAFDYADHNQEYAEAFDGAMSSYSSMQATWVLEALETYDFSSISHLCDVGGGRGYMLCQFLKKYPHLRGTVLERQEVISDSTQLWAHRMNLTNRCDYRAGNMFENVPGADAYFMKLILHDWNDEECVQILQEQFRAAPSGGRIFIVEHVIPDPATPHFSKLFDIHMMCWGTGKERTEEEYAVLLQKGGWKFIKTWYPPSQAMGLMEGRKA